MSRFKQSMSTMLVIVAAFSIIASPVSAAFELTGVACEGKVFVAFCWEEEGTAKQFELRGEETFEALVVTGTNPLLSLKLVGQEVHIFCEGAHLEGTMLQSAPLTENPVINITTVLWTGCIVLPPVGEKCRFRSEPLFNPLTSTISSPESIVLAPSTSNRWYEIALENNGAQTCPGTLKGIHALFGEQGCLWIEGKIALTEHELSCAGTESKLKFTESPAELEMVVKFKLINTTDQWDVVLD